MIEDSHFTENDASDYGREVATQRRQSITHSSIRRANATINFSDIFIDVMDGLTDSIPQSKYYFYFMSIHFLMQ